MLHRRRHAGATTPSGKLALLGELTRDKSRTPILYTPAGVTIPSTEGEARKAGVLEVR